MSVTFRLELGEPAIWDLEQEYDFMFNTLRPRQDGRHFSDEIFKCIIVNENAWILIKISLKFVPKVRNSNIPALVQIMAWRRPGDKPLSEPMIVKLPTHIWVTRPQWVKTVKSISSTLWILSIYYIARYISKHLKFHRKLNYGNMPKTGRRRRRG